MKSEEILMRQEIRQMLNEAGINRNTLKDMVKLVLDEEIEKATRQALHEMDYEGTIRKAVRNFNDDKVSYYVKEAIRDRVRSIFHGMTVSVEITDDKGHKVTSTSQ